MPTLSGWRSAGLPWLLLALGSCSNSQEPNGTLMPSANSAGRAGDRATLIDDRLIPTAGAAGTNGSGGGAGNATVVGVAGQAAGASAGGGGTDAFAAGAGASGMAAGSGGSGGAGTGEAGSGVQCDPGQHLCGPGCVRDDDVTACGAECTACPLPEHGATACTAGACSVQCEDGYLACPDSSCRPRRFRFESGALEGFALEPQSSRAAVGSPIASTFEGLSVLRTDMRVAGSARNVQLRVDLCPNGAPSDQRGKTFSANVLLDGPSLPASDGAHSISLYVWTSAGSFFVGEAPSPGANTWYTISGRLDDADTSRLIGVGIYVYVNGTTDWTGSVIVDDVHVE